jgi:hypothetical protein
MRRDDDKKWKPSYHTMLNGRPTARADLTFFEISLHCFRLHSWQYSVLPLCWFIVPNPNNTTKCCIIISNWANYIIRSRCDKSCHRCAISSNRSVPCCGTRHTNEKQMKNNSRGSEGFTIGATRVSRGCDASYSLQQRISPSKTYHNKCNNGADGAALCLVWIHNKESIALSDKISTFPSRHHPYDHCCVRSIRPHSNRGEKNA